MAEQQAPAGWDVVDGKLHRELSFQNFVEAFGFMTTVALLARCSSRSISIVHGAPKEAASSAAQTAT